VKQYEEALKQVRAKVYAEQEADRKRLLEERAGFLKEARTKARGEVDVAKEGVAGELAAAKKEIEASVAQLAVEIARRVLPAPPAPGSPAIEAR
jgi:F0F1-type ATP synthase membrane subunit b/b'